MISNGSGGMGKNVYVEFGRDEDEVLVWSGFASRVVLWCLKTGRSVEVRDPKFEGKGGKGWGFRPSLEDSGSGARGGVLAMLCRTAGQDILLLLAPRTYAVLKRVELTTIDAQGIKWSRDGRWIAVWDSASAGFKLCIYTADGHLYQTITREASEEFNEWAVEGLGIKTVEWVPGDKWLAVGGWDRRVRILSTRTFSPVVFLDHTAQICVPNAPVYTEQVDAVGARSYMLTPQPVTPPKAPVEKQEISLMKKGISILAFNHDGTLCATRDDSTPTTIWIWDLRSLKPRTILIQHAPVKSLLWHPSSSSQLLIQSTQEHPIIYIYTIPNLSASSLLPRNSQTAESPSILDLSAKIAKTAGSLPPKWEAKWLHTPADKKPALVFGHSQGYILVWPEGKDQILRFERADEDDESDDSLYDILTGRTPVPPLRDSFQRGGSGDEEYTELQGDGETMNTEVIEGMDGDGEESTVGLEDTFREKKRGILERARGRSVLDESGLDEMF